MTIFRASSEFWKNVDSLVQWRNVQGIIMLKDSTIDCWNLLKQLRGQWQLSLVPKNFWRMVCCPQPYSGRENVMLKELSRPLGETREGELANTVCPLVQSLSTLPTKKLSRDSPAPFSLHTRKSADEWFFPPAGTTCRYVALIDCQMAILKDVNLYCWLRIQYNKCQVTVAALNNANSNSPIYGNWPDPLTPIQNHQGDSSVYFKSTLLKLKLFKFCKCSTFSRSVLLSHCSSCPAVPVAGLFSTPSRLPDCHPIFNHFYSILQSSKKKASASWNSCHSIASAFVESFFRFEFIAKYRSVSFRTLCNCICRIVSWKRRLNTLIISKFPVTVGFKQNRKV